MTRWAESDDFPERLTIVADATERMLEALLSDAPLPGEEARPARFMAAMRYAALGGGTRLRPFLLVETARRVGAPGDRGGRRAAGRARGRGAGAGGGARAAGWRGRAGGARGATGCCAPPARSR